MDASPIGGSMEEAWPALVTRTTTTTRGLSIASRTLALAEVYYDGPPDDAATGTWYDHVTPAGLMAGDGGPEVVAQFCSLMTHCFHTDANGGRGDPYFTGTLSQIASSVGRDITSATGMAQAAAIMSWCRKTRTPRDMVPYVSDPMAEVERRAGATASERFVPIFTTHWRTRAYPTLDAI